MPTPTEAQEQRTLADWLNVHRLLWLHVPNEGKRSEVTGRRLKQIGLAPGAPDVLVLEPTRVWEDELLITYHGAAIELKRRGRECEKDGGVTEEQHAWLDRLRERGWAVCVAYGADHAIRWLHVMGYGDRRRSA